MSSSYLENEIAIIILNYNTVSLTISLANQIRELGLQSKLIIIDNNSKSNDISELEIAFRNDENIILISSKVNGGYSKGNNLGINHVYKNLKNIHYICIMNPDISFESKHYFLKLFEVLKENKKIGIISGIQLLDGKEEFGWKLPLYKDLILMRIPIINKLIREKYNLKIKKRILKSKGEVKVDVIPGCLFAMRTSDLFEVDSFDENVFLYFEENILTTKINHLKLECAIYPKFRFYHNHSHHKNDIQSLKKSNFYYEQSEKYYVENYLNREIGIFFKIGRYIYREFFIKLKVLVYKIISLKGKIMG